MPVLVLKHPKMFWFLCLLVAIAWISCSGLGGYVFQTYDHGARNAAFRDLINYAWPVLYSDNSAFSSYYFGFWLPPALLSKIFAPLFSKETVFLLGQHFLMLYSIIGVILFFLLIIYNQRAVTRKAIILCLLLPVFFSGMDIVGMYAVHGRVTDANHLEWWAQRWQYSSLTTCLFWVYNQTIIPWLATLIFWQERKIQDFAFLFALCCFSGPFPAVGLAIFMLVWVLYKIILSARAKSMIITLARQIFSFSNILVSLFFGLMLFTFFSQNSSIGRYPFEFRSMPFSSWLWFVILEFGAFALVISNNFSLAISNKSYRNIIFITMFGALSLLMLPQIGSGHDFPMRASIPAIIIMMMFCLDYLLTQSWKNFSVIVLCLLLLLGAATPFVEIRRNIRHALNTGKIRHLHDSIITFEGKNKNDFPHYQYVILNPSEKFFFKYFSRSLPYKKTTDEQ